MNGPVPASEGSLLGLEDRADIQGLVTSGYGHLRHSAYALVSFGNPRAARRWVAELGRQMTTATSWRAGPGEAKVPPQMTRNLGFTAQGLSRLGVSDAVLPGFPVEFLEGMTAPERALALGDVAESAPQHWQWGGAGRVPDALLVVCAGTAESAQSEAEAQVAALSASEGGSLLALETGVLREDGKEHFGFRDGIARLDIQGITGRGIRTGEFILGYENEYGYHPPTPLVPAEDDPEGVLPDSANPWHAGRRWRDLGRNGTYLVYRKLEQDVAGFWRFLEAESIRRHGTSDPHFMVWLASKMVGRWPGGAPMTLSPDRDDPAYADRDDFGYAEADAKGLRCPMGAHIRRTNPRDQVGPAGPTESANMTGRHRILRRGRPYGPGLFDGAVFEKLAKGGTGMELAGLRSDGRERGLHFLCVNANLKGQFEFIQQTWCRGPQFNGLRGNPDPLIGVVADGAPAGCMHIPRPGTDLRTAALPRFVTVRGGAYFFVPGLRALRFLSGLGGD